MQALLVAALAMALIAGCTSPSVSEEHGHVHGHLHTCPDGTRLDPAHFPDHHEPDFDITTKCPVPGEPAKVALDIDVASMVRFETATFTWSVTPASGRHHTMQTEVRVSGTPGDPMLPDEYGEPILTRSDQMVPAMFRVSWTPMEAGTYYLRAYALVEEEPLWSPEHAIEVQQVPPTGVVHDVTITAAGPLATLSPDTVTIKAGDAVRWVNEDVMDRAFVADGPAGFVVQAPAQGTSEPVVFFPLGTQDYSSEEEVLEPLAGTITVRAP